MLLLGLLAGMRDAAKAAKENIAPAVAGFIISQDIRTPICQDMVTRALLSSIKGDKKTPGNGNPPVK